jgi:hypothetical protein
MYICESASFSTQFVNVETLELRNWPFFFICSIFIFSSIVLCVCSVSSMCWAYSEDCLFVHMAWICSLYQGSNVRPACPTYLSGHSLQFSWYTPLWLCISIICYLRFRWVLIVLVVLKAISMSVFSNNFVIILVFHFTFFVFCGLLGVGFCMCVDSIICWW